MAADFERCIERVLRHEGGFSDDPHDPGNWTGGQVGVGELKGTKYGIAANTYPGINIRALTLDQAKEIYRRDFWNTSGCTSMPAQLQFQVLDAAVNHGVGTAKRMLQRALGVADDGIIGPRTLDALFAAPADDVTLRFLAARIDYYTRLSKFDRYGRGWIRRMAQNILHVAEDNG